jgi:hypothetical protein
MDKGSVYGQTCSCVSERMALALEAVLMFHAGGDWDDSKRLRWREITGTEDASTRELCNHVRRVLGRDEVYGGEPCPGRISTGHGKCTHCNRNYLGSLPAHPAYDELRKY